MGLPFNIVTQVMQDQGKGGTFIFSVILQSNWENHEHQKCFWNVIVFQEKSQSDMRKLNSKQES